MSSNIDHGVVYSIQLHRWFSPGSPISSTNKTDRHDITEIWMFVELDTLTTPPLHTHKCKLKGFAN